MHTARLYCNTSAHKDRHSHPYLLGGDPKPARCKCNTDYKDFFFLPCTTSTNVLSPLSESNLQEENYNKMQDISSSPACSSQAGHTATEKPCSTIYLFRGHEYVQLKPRSAILEEGIRRLHPPPVASPPGK